MTPKIVAAGTFSAATNVAVKGVATYDPATNRWSTLGGGIEGGISSLLSTPDGRLFAAGGFANPGGTPVLRVAQWTGTQWQDVGGTTPDPGFRGGFSALSIMNNGDIILVGNFNNVAGVPANDLARWNGNAWSPFGTGIGGSTGVPNVIAVLPLSATELVVAGSFNQADGSTANNIAGWNGSAGVPLGTGTNGSVLALARLNNGDIVAAGNFTTAGGVTVNRIARWNGSVWSALGSGANGQVGALLTLPSGDLLAGGSFTTVGGVAARGVARWNGSTWSALGAGITAFNSVSINGITLGPAGQLFFAGSFENAGATPARNAARWDGTTWRALGEGIIGSVRTIAPRGAAELFIGGEFTLVTEQSTITNLAHWTGSQWRAVGPALPDFSVRSLAVTPTGNLVLGSWNITTIGGVTVNNLARWNGATWSALGSGVNGLVNTVVALPGGQLLAGGSFVTAGNTTVNRLARWNGNAWTPVGSGVGNGVVNSIVAVSDSEQLVAGNFPTAGPVTVNDIARWNGTAWSSFASGVSGSISAIARAADGKFVAVGPFALQLSGGTLDNVSNVALWNGTEWARMGPGFFDAPPSTAVALPDGGFIVGGDFDRINNISFLRTARWNGTAWVPLNGTLNGDVTTLVNLPGGDVIAGGAFTRAGGKIAVALARYKLSCACTPSDVASAGPIAGSDGELTADDIILFINLFVSGNQTADIASSGQLPQPDGELTADDVILFISRFVAGC
jgi:hypothetical protein